ncbi:hypothetical protein NEOLEDRAFT_1143063 [Neolentinus lepideus HHB14362 ss-1]|uniref:F-box domain-containing protein n=1 Tax=Neolentinus lepideus HHB14362 ss-1 TaxID=1314782 RepID=A0A165MS16_9AGAM|nr:hypothetical protein NEOLEDRAFT_1143063 [Neolentinus lepideus HHB14362 ss-1]
MLNLFFPFNSFNALTNSTQDFSSTCARPDLHVTTLDALPFDVLIDHILSLLEVKDILALRTTNKFFSNLTREAAIWKRLFNHYPSPLPPVPPTIRYSLGKMSAKETETLLSRAMTFSKNWGSPEPTPYNIHSFDAYYNVLSMTILPGGHYLVASVCTAGRTRYYVTLFALDNPTPKGFAYPLATMPVKTRAYDLHAKYMYINKFNSHAIVVSYTRRQNPKHNPGPDASLYSDKYEINERLKYETVVSGISLYTLDQLAEVQSKFQPGSVKYREYLEGLPEPFSTLAVIRSTSALCCPSLEYLGGKTYFSVIRRPDAIIFKNLEREEERAFRYECLSPPSPLAEDSEDAIVAFRNLPFDRKILVAKRFIRRTNDADGKVIEEPMLAIQFYPAIYNSDVQCKPLDTWEYQSCVRSIHISEPHYPYFHDDATEHHFLPNESQDPPVISIYCRTINPDRFIFIDAIPMIPNETTDPLVHCEMRSHLRQVRKQDWRARLYPPHSYCSGNMLMTEFEYPDAFGTAFMLPGNGRAAFWSVPLDDRTDAPKLVNIWSFVRDPEDAGLLPPECILDRTRMDCFTPVALDAEFMKEFEDGVQAITWDEHIGRLCLSGAEDSYIYVVDFAKSVDDEERASARAISEGKNRMRGCRLSTTKRRKSSMDALP